MLNLAPMRVGVRGPHRKLKFATQSLWRGPLTWNLREERANSDLSPQAAIGFTHLENRLKHEHLDEPRFRKQCGFGHRPIVEKTPLFHRGRPAVERCVHTIAASGERSEFARSSRKFPARGPRHESELRGKALSRPRVRPWGHAPSPRPS